MIKHFGLAEQWATIQINDDATQQNYQTILTWLHQRISEKHWEDIKKKIEENKNAPR